MLLDNVLKIENWVFSILLFVTPKSLTCLSIVAIVIECMNNSKTKANTSTKSKQTKKYTITCYAFKIFGFGLDTTFIVLGHKKCDNSLVVLI